MTAIQPAPYDANAERIRRETERDQRLAAAAPTAALTSEPIVKWPAETLLPGPTVKTVDLDQWHRDREARERAEKPAPVRARTWSDI